MIDVHICGPWWRVRSLVARESARLALPLQPCSLRCFMTLVLTSVADAATSSHQQQATDASRVALSVESKTRFR